MTKLKKYYRIIFSLASPLSVGCGENRLTDSDIIRDSRGIPYIPGTALAGVYRSLFEAEEARKYFGEMLTMELIRKSSREGRNLLDDSKIVVYDARMLHPEKRVTAVRDMVALDEYKTSIPGAKFDFEILEPGVTFVTYLEQNMDHPDQQYVSDEIAHAWMEGSVKIGAKTARGYGQTRCMKAETCMFDLTDAADLDRWLDFDMYAGEEEEEKSIWKAAGTDCCLSGCRAGDGRYGELEKIYREQGICLKRKEEVTLTLSLVQKGGISVRQYSTDPKEADYRQLTENPGSDLSGKAGEEGVPVIPGTSWAGAFRAQMEKLDEGFRRKGTLAETFFGAVKSKEQDSRKSRVRFSQSRLSGGKWVSYTRNAIDRFSGGTVDGALYTEKTYYNGSASLEITCDMHKINPEERERFARALAAAVMDLHYGYLSVGGLTAVGRGIFEIKKLTAGEKEYSFAQEPADRMYGRICRIITGKEEGQS